MADAVVNITAGSGTPIRVLSGMGPSSADQQVMTLADSAGNLLGTAAGPLPTQLGDGTRTATISPWGALDSNPGVGTLFYDTFVGPLDTTDKWTVTGNAPTFSGGALVMSAAASTYNTIRSKDNIRANAGFTYVANGVQLETAAAVGAGRFWGLGTNATTPAAAVLVQDGIGFEIDQATGNLLAVTYAAGVRTTVASLARPADGALHRYAMYFRVTQAWWFIDNMVVPVASQAFPNVAVPEIPALIVRQNAATFTGTPVMNNTAHLTGETSQTKVIADPVVGIRQARVKAASTPVAATDNALVVGLHPSSPLPAGTNNIGVVTIGASGGQASLSGTISTAAANTPGTAVTASSTGAIVANVSSAGNATFHLVTAAFVGTVIFEASVDAGLNYAPVITLREDGSGAETGLVISTAAAFIRQYTVGLPGLTYFRIRCSAFTSGTLAVVIQPGPILLEPTPAVSIIPSTSATMAGFTASASAVTLLAANASRKGASIQNGTTAAVLYVRLGTPAAISSGGFHVVLVAGAYYEVPVGYNGVISGIWASATGYANVGELT